MPPLTASRNRFSARTFASAAEQLDELLPPHWLTLKPRTTALSKRSVEPIQCHFLGTGTGMKRREFLGALGGGALTWPLAARAQKPIRVVGFLHARSAEDVAYLTAA